LKTAYFFTVKKPWCSLSNATAMLESLSLELHLSAYIKT
jgi:hypothetical protein